LGQRLYVDGHYTRIPLPFEILAHLPYLKSLLAIRFSLFTVMFGAGIVAIGLDVLYWRLMRMKRPSWPSAPWRGVAAVSLPLALGVLAALPLVSSSAQEATPSHLSPYFTSRAVNAIPAGSVVLSYPYPKSPQIGRSYADLVDQALLDQAVSGMRFKLIGGYGWWPVPNETYATPDPPPLKPFIVETYFDWKYYGTATPAQLVQLYQSYTRGDLPATLRQFMIQNHVGTVVVLPLGKHPATVIGEVTSAIGPPSREGGVDVWLRVQQRLAASTGN